MKAIAKRATVMVLVGLTFFAGYIVGAWDGIYQFQLLNGATKASLLSGELRVLRAGKGEKLIPGKEIELDGEIAAYSIMQEKGRPWIFWPVSSVFDHEASILTAVAYRKEYPSLLTDEFISKMGTSETRAGAKETAERINAVVTGNRR